MQSARPSTFAREAPATAPPGADAAQPSHAALYAEGAEYAEALLSNIRAGKAAPTAIADLVQFLADGQMLAAACTVLHRAIREGAGRA